MRRVLAIIGLFLAISGFVMLALSLPCDINYLIPIGCIFLAFVCLFFAKRMGGRSVADDTEDTHGN